MGAVLYATVIAMMAIQASSLGFSPLIPFMKEAWGMSYTQMGTFTGLYGLVALLMSLPAGLLAKRFGEKKVLSAGLVLAAVGLLLVALATGYVQGLVSRTLWLIGYRLAFISVVTAVAVTVPGARRGNAMGLVGALTALATILGSGFSIHMQASVGWRLSMVGFAAIALIAAAYSIYFYRPATVQTGQTAAARSSQPRLSKRFGFRSCGPFRCWGWRTPADLPPPFSFLPWCALSFMAVRRRHPPSSRSPIRWPSLSICCVDGWPTASIDGWYWRSSAQS